MTIVVFLIFALSMQPMNPKCIKRENEYRWQGCPFIYYF